MSAEAQRMLVGPSLGQAGAPLVLAGAPALDRRVFPRPGSVPRWFEPFHVRRPQVARGEMTAQVVAGADIVVAPAWLTHRRALEAVGESRRAREWTGAAVRIARESIEAGLERRDGGTGPVLVAGPLPDVSARPESATGRLLPASAAAERDTHDQAGILADVGVDLILVEGRPTFEAARLATETATGSGRQTWTTVPLIDSPTEPPLAERLDILATSGASGFLLEPDPSTDPARIADLLVTALATQQAHAPTPIGIVVAQPPFPGADDDVDAWLRAGVRVLGIGSGADTDALQPLVAARDRHATARRELADRDRGSLAEWIGEAVRRAPGGRALWLGEQVIDPPSGFDWTVLEAPDVSLGGLPDGAFRLVVVLDRVDPERLARLVERGGVVALQAAAGSPSDLVTRSGRAGLRALAVAAAPDGRQRLIWRREDD